MSQASWSEVRKRELRRSRKTCRCARCQAETRWAVEATTYRMKKGRCVNRRRRAA